jgi:hypothetical protein
MNRLIVKLAHTERQIGPIGTAARLVGGMLAITLPIAIHGLSRSEAAVALVGLPVIAAVAAPLITAVYRSVYPTALRSQHAICSPLGCTLIAVMVAANGAIVAPTHANGNVTIWVWLGASMLIAAARGYAGCEVLAISNLITGRRDQIGCILYTPIDTAEAERRLRDTMGASPRRRRSRTEGFGEDATHPAYSKVDNAASTAPLTQK